ncbi:MAG: hypothetical protein KKD07_05065 [Candidatus Omnitrophica bacterium]|nr:hypothetical protein [Candidatus Omnitrophota bacterium]MBU4333792.1 hypothetical protein [Candidatus Omnitrophota bacterium]
MARKRAICWSVVFSAFLVIFISGLVMVQSKGYAQRCATLALAGGSPAVGCPAGFGGISTVACNAGVNCILCLSSN